jgi:hypothetical protein
LQLATAYDEIDGVTETTELVGTIAFHPTDDSLLLFTVDTDTAPANTLSPVDAIIDPHSVNVDSNNLLSPATGTRYLIIGEIGAGTQVWGNFSAHANDIIEYNGSNWTISLDSTTHTQLEYVTNLNTGIQYKWLGGNWTKSIDGVYHEGEWSIIL